MSKIYTPQCPEIALAHSVMPQLRKKKVNITNKTAYAGPQRFPENNRPNILSCSLTAMPDQVKFQNVDKISPKAVSDHIKLQNLPNILPFVSYFSVLTLPSLLTLNIVFVT